VKGWSGDVTHAVLSPLIGPEFDEFLGASIGEDRNGTGLSVLSAFARLNVDPWQEAMSLARMPRNAAVVRLNALIDALPGEPPIDIPARTIGADLVALLPRNDLNVRSPDDVFAAVGSRQRQILIALSAFVTMLIVVFVLSAILSPCSETVPIRRLAATTPQRETS
jgi:hypothetical protein